MGRRAKSQSRSAVPRPPARHPAGQTHPQAQRPPVAHADQGTSRPLHPIPPHARQRGRSRVRRHGAGGGALPKPAPPGTGTGGVRHPPLGFPKQSPRPPDGEFNPVRGGRFLVDGRRRTDDGDQGRNPFAAHRRLSAPGPGGADRLSKRPRPPGAPPDPLDEPRPQGAGRHPRRRQNPAFGGVVAGFENPVHGKNHPSRNSSSDDPADRRSGKRLHRLRSRRWPSRTRLRTRSAAKRSAAWW